MFAVSGSIPKEHRLGPLIEDAVAGRDEAERSCYDLVPLADPEGADKQVQATRAAVDGDRSLSANVSGNGPRVFPRLWTMADGRTAGSGGPANMSLCFS